MFGVSASRNLLCVFVKSSSYFLIPPSRSLFFSQWVLPFNSFYVNSSPKYISSHLNNLKTCLPYKSHLGYVTIYITLWKTFEKYCWMILYQMFYFLHNIELTIYILNDNFLSLSTTEREFSSVASHVRRRFEIEYKFYLNCIYRNYFRLSLH